MTEDNTHCFERIAIINRGEPAMRLIRALRDWNHRRADHLRAIALYTDPDRDALFVREADEAFAIGPALDLGCGGYSGTQRRSRYLNYDVLRETLAAARADAAWVGWGFVAEHAAFAELCSELGIRFVGPPASAMRRLGDKIDAKRLAEAASVPVAAWSGGPVADVTEAMRAAERIGFPLFIKATAGGGGRGIRLVESPHDLEGAFASAASEAHKAFGDPTVFLEARVAAARHIEVQVLADEHGTVWPVGLRDCTAQRNNQKVIEEAPSPALNRDQERRLCDAAVRLAREAGYVNAGTVEFLYEPGSGGFYFMEMNTRLQVEHPVTEATTGLDLVALQIAIARGERLPETPPSTRGHAIEVRLCAEDPERGFAPAPGRVARFRPPLGPGLRTDTGVFEGDEIPVEFDSMIAKVIASGETRDEALARLRRALHEMLVVVDGGTTNRAFLLRLLTHPDFAKGDIHTRWIDGIMRDGSQERGPDAPAAVIAAAIRMHEQQLRDEQLNFFASASRGRPTATPLSRRPIQLRYDGRTYELKVGTLEPGLFRVHIDGDVFDVGLLRDGEHEGRLSYESPSGPRRHRVLTVPAGLDWLVEVDGAAYRISCDPGGVLRAPAPGLVLCLQVAPGDVVRTGDRLLALEAMKMEMSVGAPFAGRVRQVLVGKGMQVAAGTPLVVIEPETSEAAAAAVSEELRFRERFAPRTSGEGGLTAAMADLRRLLLGFEVGEEVLADVLAAWHAAAASVEAPVAAAAVQRLLELHLTTETPFGHQYSATRLSYEHYLHHYLREFRAEGCGLPEEFLTALRAALALYGVSSLTDSPRLREALVWLCRSHRNGAQKNRVIESVLEACAEHAAPWMEPLRTAVVRGLLDRVVALAQDENTRLCEAAQQARYAIFDGQELEAQRRAALSRTEAVLARVQQGIDDTERRALMLEVTAIPFSMAGHLAPLLTVESEERRAVILEVLLRRSYRHRSVDDVCVLSVAGRAHVMATLDGDDGATVIAAHLRRAELHQALVSLETLVQQLPAEARVFCDLWETGDEGLDESRAEALAQEVVREASRIDDPRIARLCFARARHGGRPSYTTFRMKDGRLAEDELLRDMHPSVGERLELWRLGNFELQRLTAADDLHLFLGRARTNGRDERFFAVTEVREVHALRDAKGCLLALPELECAILGAFNAIREQQAHRDARKRLYWNRVTLFLRPTLLARREELLAIARRLHASALSIGLEKVAVHARLHEDAAQVPRPVVVSFTDRTGLQVELSVSAPHKEPLRVLDDYSLKLVRARQRRMTYVYEVVKMLAPAEPTLDMPRGRFEECDLSSNGAGDELVSVAERPYGHNTANVVVGVITSHTAKHPEGMRRVIILGDGTREMGALAEPECRRIIAAIDLAERQRLPLEWFPISSGAKIAMDSGTENLDWTAAVLRRIIEFTQRGGVINLVVDGINVGAQSYWNAEATMLMHTRGCLIMTPRGSMLLTGKRALDYSGGVSADDNLGIGGFERIMGPNGQAQFYARDLADACRILMRYYEHSYVAPGERQVRRRLTTDPVDRDIRAMPYAGAEPFRTIGDLWSDEQNPGRKKPFDIRTLLAAVTDADAEPLERWPALHDGEAAVVWESHVGGYPACLIGIESKVLPRLGDAPADGPDSWSGGTLFPLGSKKVARALNACSESRPAVVIANLSGFDGSPESMRRLQLEYGAEIGRAVVNFKGPLVFAVVARYHGGAYVVFSKRLNPSLRVVALEGTYASVIGGAPAAAVVFSEEVRAATLRDPRIVAMEARLHSEPMAKGALRRQYDELFARVHAEKTQQIAERFDGIHTVRRALDVGSLDAIIDATELRPAVIAAIEAGLATMVAGRGLPLGTADGRAAEADGAVETAGSPLPAA